jgi:hypothetical protein
MRRRLHGAAALAVVGALALSASGCGSDDPTPPPLASTAVASPGSTTPSPSDSPTSKPSASASTTAGASTADRAAGQKVIQVFLGHINDAAAAKSDAPLKGTWQPSCIWCATVIQPLQMAGFAKNWSLTPARVSNPHITYSKNGIPGQLLFRVTMSVSAMKLVDDKGHTQRSSAAVHQGSFGFAAEKVSGTWQVVQGIQGDITVPKS